jgi:hypothetical protein
MKAKIFFAWADSLRAQVLPAFLRKYHFQRGNKCIYIFLNEPFALLMRIIKNEPADFAILTRQVCKKFTHIVLGIK